MKAYPLAAHLPDSSPIVCGCMGLGGDWSDSSFTPDHVRQANEMIDAALDCGINYFDHADIYTYGKAEAAFGQALNQRSDRERLTLQSKCGIRFEDEHGPKRYDLSAPWIIQSVNASLARLQTDYLDVLVLHRPDPLMQPEEIAGAFATLRQQGKVRHFGVSNMHQHQIAALQAALDVPLIVNQVEVSLQYLDWLDEGVYAGHPAGRDVNFAPGLTQYCAGHDIQLQAWGSLCQGKFSGADVSGEPANIQATAALVARLASDYDVSPEAIVLAWLMRHPGMIQPVIGTARPDRIRACAQAVDVTLSREHWYQLYVSARGDELP